MYLNDPVLSCHLKIPLNLCCQLFDNVNNFLLFVKNLFFKNCFNYYIVLNIHQFLFPLLISVFINSYSLLSKLFVFKC